MLQPFYNFIFKVLIPILSYFNVSYFKKQGNKLFKKRISLNNIAFCMYFTIVCFYTITNPVNAQLRWKNIDSLYAPLPKGIHVFFSNDSIDGKPNIAYYVEADVNNKQLQFTTQTGNGKRYTPSQYFEQEGKPTLVVNCTFFEFKTNKNLNVVVKNGNLQAYNITAIPLKKDSSYKYVSRSAIGINKHRKATVAWTFTDSSKKYPYALESPIQHNSTNAIPTIKQAAFSNNKPIAYTKWKMQTAVGGGPRLLENGNINITNNQENMFVGTKGLEEKHPRTAMGYTANNTLIIMVVQGRFPGKAEGMSLLQQAKTLQQIGCVNALNLDGGGSSCLLINGKPTIQVSDKEGQRPVPAVFIIQ